MNDSDIKGVRAVQQLTMGIVTLLFAAGVIYGFLFRTGLVSSDAFMGLAGLVVGFWFKERITKAAEETGGQTGRR